MSRDSVRRAIRTFVVAFLGIAIPGLLGFMNNVTAWAADNGQHAFPDWHDASFILVSAVSAGMIALLNLGVNLIEDATGKGFLRTVPPKNAPPA